MENRETGIPCFKCRERSGIDCAGRRLDEATLCLVCADRRLYKATRCLVCFDRYMKQVRLAEKLHMRQFESQSQSSQSSTQGSSGDTV